MELEMWQSKEVDQLAGAIVRAQMRMKPAVKDCTNPFFKSKYADLASVWISVTPFCEESIAITQMPMPSGQGEIALDTQLTHGPSGQWMRSRTILPVAKNDPQGYGSAITYARRYALGCMTGVVTEEDDDGNAASRPMHKKESPLAPPPPRQIPEQEDGAQVHMRSGSPSSTATPSKASDAPAPNYGVFIWQYGQKFKGFQIVDIPFKDLKWFSEQDRTPDDHKEAALVEMDRRRV